MSTLTAREAELSILGGNAAVLRLKWQAALVPGHDLPPYEQVVLGSLGRWADHLLLLGGAAPADFKVMQAGRAIRDWVGREITGAAIDELPTDCAVTLGEAVTRALTACEPMYSIGHRVRDGLVETYEILALPMSC